MAREHRIEVNIDDVKRDYVPEEVARVVQRILREQLPVYLYLQAVKVV